MRAHRFRSYVRRDSRRTPAQERAYAELWPRFGLNSKESVDYAREFGRSAACFLEIGFGSGQSLLTSAKAHPERNFIGIETHKPGIGALLLGMQKHQVDNIRLFYDDVVAVLARLPENGLDGINIFFPDPWPKRKHHPRRLLQGHFIEMLKQKLKSAGLLHIATDWQDYAVHMMRTITVMEGLANPFGVSQFAPRSAFRPIVTKFERRALCEGRRVWELQFQKL